MFKFSAVKQLHLEITNNCQASCPMCSRNIHGGLPNPLLNLNEWSLADFKTIITPEVLNQIDSYYFCGNFGDPLLNNNLLDMCLYSVNTAPDVQIRIHTNGSLRNTQWWGKLAKILSGKHTVIFAIDGFEDTNHLYRIGTNYNKIIENARAFINAGGNAEWAFIRFKHNEHQVDQARKLANEYGFKTFTMKDSSRFLMDPAFPVYDKDGNTTHCLEPAGVSEIKFINKQLIENYKTVVKNTEIRCQSMEDKELYIDASRRVFPCCYIGMIPYIPLDTVPNITGIRIEILNEYRSLLADLGGTTALDATVHSIREILESIPFQTVWQKYWDEKKLITCTRSCGVSNNFSNPRDQFTDVSCL
jgi:MoaA/NifB/PqqE/SkfB family radical SAM enzyme